MVNIKKNIKNNVGILYCIAFAIIFYIIAISLAPYFQGAQWYIVSSIQRAIFGVIELLIFVKVYKRENWRKVINCDNMKNALISSTGMIILIVFFVIYILIAAKSFVDTTFLTVISCLVFQQLTTSFYEELTYRAFLLEGYFYSEKKTWKTRLAYASLSFIIFGLAHAIECESFTVALEKFIITGIMGFVYASIYLYSHNILLPMILHFIYDIPANAMGFIDKWNHSTLFSIMENYVYSILFGIMFILSIIFVLKGEKAKV